MTNPITRRRFLGTSAAAAASIAVVSRTDARPETSPAPSGPIYGLINSRGIKPGTASAPSRGGAVLLDGRMVEISHVARRGIAPGKSVLLSPEPGSGFSILYAEV